MGGVTLEREEGRPEMGRPVTVRMAQARNLTRMGW